MYNDVV